MQDEQPSDLHTGEQSVGAEGGPSEAAGSPPSPANFSLFLNRLSPDPAEAARRYLSLHRRLAGYLSLKGVDDPDDAADETLERAVRRICEGAPVPDVERYCLGIARFIGKERVRKVRREVSSFVRFCEDLDSGAEEEVERIYRVLKPCFDGLPAEDRELMVNYYEDRRGRARAEHRRRLAKRLNVTMLGLRMRVTRVRRVLADCAKKTEAAAGA